MGDLDRLQEEVNNDLLDAWIMVYAKAQTIYDGLPEEEKLRIEEHGHEVESLVWVIVQMKPHVRALCWSLVEQGRAASVSHPAPRVEHTVDETARAKAGGEQVDGVEARIAALEERMGDLVGMVERMDALTEAVDELEEWKATVALSFQTISAALSPPCTSGTDE